MQDSVPGTHPPTASRPSLPAAYGVPIDQVGLLEWRHADERLTAARTYWLITASAGGEPHARPVDGVWWAGRLYFGGDPATRWARNLTENPRATIHLESGTDVVIVKGRVIRLTEPDAALVRAVSEACQAQYGAGTTPPWWVLVPRVALAWTNMAVDPTRWHFDEI